MLALLPHEVPVAWPFVSLEGYVPQPHRCSLRPLLWGTDKAKFGPLTAEMVLIVVVLFVSKTGFRLVRLVWFVASLPPVARGAMYSVLVFAVAARPS